MSSIQNRRFVSLAAAATSSRANCRHGQADRFAGPVRTVVDDSGSLAITAWTCAVCGDVIEELHLLSRDGKTEPYPIRRAVSSQAETRRPAALPVSREAAGMVMTSRRAVEAGRLG
jgi:hypothetical protein